MANKQAPILDGFGDSATAVIASKCDHEWLTLREASEYLKIQPRTLALWARQKKVPGHRLSGIRRCVWRFLRSELDAMLCASSAGSADGRQQ